MLRFLWNGIKGSDNRLQKCHYSDGALRHHPAGTITIYARDHIHFSAEVRAAFTVENDSDMMTDYFEQDRIRVLPSHPLYEQVKSAQAACKAHHERRFAKHHEIHADGEETQILRSPLVS